MEFHIDEIIQFWEQVLTKCAEEGDVLDLSRSVTFLIWDSVSSLAFGKEFGLLKSGHDKNRVSVAFAENFTFSTLLRLVPQFRSLLFSQRFQKFAPLPEDVGIGLVCKVRLFSGPGVNTA